ncbi:ACT domain-containing protein [Methylobacterium sp. SyP6R]|uniref:ACT domain-containing protein n=1 Tax=Methylobacterium sp. SyP6R TaxID=2718876 RepID=UPI001F285A48|nr:ACT domain-containing protein [Methylobacterium sp. SyP6R]MCF4128425.1 ACT domain-containing protein [Methylobacterium sp. SyP6R]
MINHIVRERNAMIAAMKPELDEGTYFFCSTRDSLIIERCAGKALMIFVEKEGVTLLLKRTDAEAHGFGTHLPMSRIVLEVFSALDGVGLTAAVASTLADEGISCNVVAAYHHDHVFVPQESAEAALNALKSRQQQAKNEVD